MKIVSSGVQMSSFHASAQHHEVKESLRMWVAPRRPDFEGRGRPQLPSPTEAVRISDAGRAAQGSEAELVDEAADESLNDPRLTLLRAMLRYIMGQEVEIFDARELQAERPSPEIPQPPAASRPAGWGMEYERHERYTEVEETRFSASGTVQTADGREIGFSLELSMARSYHEESSVSLRLGNARQVQDPLVINFGGSAARLIDQRFSFDLNADGTASEQINYLAGGAGFLAFDRNGNRRIDNGTELFGARSGDGFAELAELDSDCNGWIDENDALYAQLSVWSKDVSGTDALLSLKRADVGAIALARAETPFSLKDENNDLLGQIRSSGVYLKDSGGIGSIQQIDFTA